MRGYSVLNLIPLGVVLAIGTAIIFQRSGIFRKFDNYPGAPGQSYAEAVRQARASLGPDADTQSLIHLPLAGCPPGYRLVTGLFHRGNESFDGCVKESGAGAASGSMDFLLGGESVSIPFVIPLPGGEAPKKGNGKA